MSPVGTGILSLTKFYRLRDLVGELALVAPGMTPDQVRGVLASGHQELADDLVLYESGAAVDDPLLQACRSGSGSALPLIWIALTMADHRLAQIVESYLTDGDGRLLADHFDTDSLESALRRLLPSSAGTRKPATNILSYLRDSGLVAPVTHRGTIVGIESMTDASPFVRDAVRYLMFRLQHMGLAYPLDGDDAEVGLWLNANHWLNLTAEAWRAAYHGTAPEQPSSLPAPRSPSGLGPAMTSEVEVEAQNTESYEVSGQRSGTAVRREQTLVIAYKVWIEAKGSEIVRYRIRPPGVPAHLYNDAYDRVRNNLIEGKANATRPSIRMAIGQLMDYRRFAPSGVKLAVLTTRRPHPDLELLLRSLGIACIWRSDDGFEDNADGAFV